tara:strand:+ start:2600 stop:3721 length:1122 start_codon:yes stop_codon:yes gene_type:complete
MKYIHLKNLENVVLVGTNGKKYIKYNFRYMHQGRTKRISLGTELNSTTSDVKIRYKIAQTKALNLQLGFEVSVPGSRDQSPRKEPVLLAKVFDKWVNINKNSSKSFLNHIHNMKHFVYFFGKESDWKNNRVTKGCKIDLAQLNANDIDEFYNDQIEKGFTKSTIQKRHNYLNPFYAWLKRNKYLEENYYLEKSKLKVKNDEKIEFQALDRKDIMKIINQVKNHNYKVLWTIMAYSGLSPIDASTLDKRKDIVHNGKFTCIVTKRTKTKVIAQIPILGDLDKLGDLIFNLDMTKKQRDNANKEFKRLAKANGIIAKEGYKISQYCLRHSLTTFLRPYLTDNEIQLFMGHTNTNQQTTYTQVSQEMYEKLESVLK